MSQNEGLLSGGWSRLAHNKRYIFWFYVLSVVLAWFGAGAFQNQVHAILDHSLQASRLVQGFDLGAFIELLARPEYGPLLASAAPAMHFAVLFFLLTALFLPGVLQGYASTYRLPREDFFRACGRNLWRFVRLMILAGIVFSVVGGILFSIRAALLKSADESTYEMLSFYVSMASLLVIFLAMTWLRIWFDLAQADVVLSDRGAVRRSIGLGFRHTWRNLGRVLWSYVVAAILAAFFLIGGLWVWIKFVPPTSVLGAAVVSQLTLLLLLIPRFWQRGVAVTYYLQNMVEPITVHSFEPAAVTATPVVQPVVIAPAPPGPTSEPQAS